MWQPEFLWFFTIFHHEFRKNNPIAFEVLMVLAVAHLFGFYNPKRNRTGSENGHYTTACAC